MDIKVSEPQVPVETPVEASPPIPAVSTPPVDPETSPIDDEAVDDGVEETPVVEEPPFVPHGQVDSAFNCQPCQGEGLLTNGNVCDTCGGTGKVEVEK